jgi:chorismate synthase
MPGNCIGNLFRLCTFGESHGPAIGGIIDGCPAGLEIDSGFIRKEMARRKPGQSAITTPRSEADEVEWLSGIFEGKSTGAPIAFIIRNTDARSEDYGHLKNVFRPSHADYTYLQKYGLRDHRGGGRASARETACRVAGGAIAKLLLKRAGIEIKAWVSAVAGIDIPVSIAELDLSAIESNPVRCPHHSSASSMQAEIEKARQAKDSLGGVITCLVSPSIPGLGEPVFDKLHADLAKAMLSINASKGFEIGSGFAGSRRRGSEENDAFSSDEQGNVRFLSNNSGGVQGGISNGNDIVFRVAFKPVSTIGIPQQTVDTEGKTLELEAAGRHDPCVVPRAVPIVEAMTALVLADHFLRNATITIDKIFTE